MSFHFLYKSFRAFLAAVSKWFHETGAAVWDFLGAVHPHLSDTPQLQTAAQHSSPPLRDILTAVTSGHVGSAALEYNKGGHATGEGDRYEERMLALVFLRCLRRGLVFRLSANNSDAGKFDDLVLVWRPEEHAEARTLLVQLKHKTSPKSMTIHIGTWLSEATNTDFGLSKYSSSYGDISKKLQMHRVTCVLLTNASLSDSSLTIFEPQDVDCVPGLDLLQAGGDLYRLKPDNQQVWKAVRGNSSFVEHFYLMCHQRNSAEIFGDLFKELEELLGDSELCGSTCDRLCKCVREWMNEEKVWLTSGWRKWQQLVDEYVRKDVTDCIAVTTNLRYCNVADVRGYIESCNPAWVRPPERGTGALSTTKIHQALANQAHIMVDINRFRLLRRRILHCWRRFCRWLVILDDEQHGNFDILSDLVAHISTERRLVIVSLRDNNSFVDICQSSDISDDSWEECLDISVRLNGERYQCRLRDLVAGVDDLKSLLDGQPALLLAVARLSQPLRMGQELETLPDYYMPRKVVDQWLDEILSTVGGIGEYGEKENKKQFQTLDSTNNVVIVEGRPGVGKSKMLSHMAKKIKERDPGCWVLRVNLLHYYTVLDMNTSGVSALEDILKETLFNKDQWSKLEYILLRHILMESARVVCLVDGFDEVCPDYVDKCLEVLPLLAPRHGKLVVTTRPAAVKILETQMGISAHCLEPFSDSELQDLFAYHPFRENIATISGLKESIRGLLRIPLFAIMFINLSAELTESCDIVTLYEAFFRNKFMRLYQEKWGDNLSAPGKKKEFEKAQQVHEEQLMNLAASVLISSVSVPAMALFETDHFLNAGIVYKFAAGKPMFLHRTFAEHFLAKWCFTSLEGEQKRSVAYRTACNCGTMEFFLESFDRRAVMGHPLLEPLLGAVLGCDEGRVEALLAGGADLSQTDRFGRNALHLAAAHSTLRSLPLLRRLCGHTDGGLLSAKDGLLQWTPRDYAAVCGCWDAEQVLLEFHVESCDTDKLYTVDYVLSQIEDFQAVQHNLDRLQDGDYTLGLLENFYLVCNDRPNLLAIFFWNGYRGLYQYVIQVNHPLWHYLDHPLWECRAVTVQMEFAVSLISANMPYKSLNLIAEKAQEEGHTIVHSLLLHAIYRREIAPMETANGRITMEAECNRNSSSCSDISSRNRSCAVELGGGASHPQGGTEQVPPEVIRGTEEAAPQLQCQVDIVRLLHYGAAIDDTDILRALINLETDVHGRSIFSWTALHFAAYFGSRECMLLLRDAGLDLEAKCEDGLTALHLAAGRGHVESVKQLLEIGSVVDARDPDGHTPLVYAVGNGNAECVRLLIAAGADVNIQENGHLTLHHIAAEVGSAECIKLLADAGLSVVGRGGVEHSPLHTAASWGNTDCVRLLMHLGASVHEQDWEGCTPLHLAAYNGHAECVKLLLDSGSDLHAQDEEGSTPLHAAVQVVPNVDCVHLLLDASAGITARDMHGDTPLHKAVAGGSVECVAALVAAGSDLQSKGRKSRTPLHHAARHGSAACAAFLLAEGADVEAQDRHGNTALHVAAYQRCANVIPVLLQAGADRDVRNRDGVTALQLAIKGGYYDCVAALLDWDVGESCGS